MAPRTPLLAPATYFDTRSSSLRSGAGLFVLYLLLETLWPYFAVRRIFDQVTNLDPQLEQAALSVVTTVLVLAAILLPIGWLIVAAIMHYGSGGAKTDGTFTDALGVAGWAYAPEVVLFVPGVLYSWQRIQNYSFDGSDPQQLATEFEAVASQTQLSPIPILLVLVTTVWSVYILAHGVSETHDVSLETATAPAVVVGVGSLVLWLLG